MFLNFDMQFPLELHIYYNDTHEISCFFHNISILCMFSCMYTCVYVYTSFISLLYLSEKKGNYYIQFGLIMSLIFPYPLSWHKMLNTQLGISNFLNDITFMLLVYWILSKLWNLILSKITVYISIPKHLFLCLFNM